MEALFVLLFVAACHGIPVDVQQAPQLNLPIPELKRLESVDDPNNITSHEIVHWTAVESNEPDNPVIGYKVSLKFIQITLCPRSRPCHDLSLEKVFPISFAQPYYIAISERIFRISR